jgi:hypothetical protein
MEELIKSYKNLDKIAKVTLEFNVLKGNEELNQIKYLLENTEGFNGKDNQKIADTFTGFVKSLPEVYYGEGNPNNGNYLFNKIRLMGDDTIELKAFTSKNEIDAVSERLKKLVNEYGKLIDADEYSIKTTNSLGDYYETVIRFWWD